MAKAQSVNGMFSKACAYSSILIISSNSFPYWESEIMFSIALYIAFSLLKNVECNFEI